MVMASGVGRVADIVVPNNAPQGPFPVGALKAGPDVPPWTPIFPPSAPLLRVVATGGEVAYLSQGAAATSTTRIHEHRTRHIVGPGGIKAGTGRINNHAFRAVGGTGEVDAPGYNVQAHMEYNGVAYVAKWDGGNAKGRCQTGAADYNSDPMVGHPDIPGGSAVWFVRRREYAVGDMPHYFLNGAFSPVVNDNVYIRGDGSGQSFIGVPGAMSATTGWTAINTLYAPPVLVGEPITPSLAVPFYIAGASIEYGLVDGNGDGINGAGGYIRRALAQTGVAYPFIMAAAGSEASADFIASGARRQQYMKYARGGVALQAYGGNDYARGFTVDQFWNNFLAINSMFQAAGINKRAGGRLHCKTNSTDGYTTVANQTPQNNFTAYRNDVDQRLQALLAAGGIGLILNDTNAIEATPGIYKAPGYVSDGTHPTALGHSELAPAARALFNGVGWTQAA